MGATSEQRHRGATFRRGSKLDATPLSGFEPLMLKPAKCGTTAVRLGLRPHQAQHPHPEDGFAGMMVRGDALTDKDNAGAAILEACKEIKGRDGLEIGIYRGFALSLTIENFGQDIVLTLKGQMSHRATLGKDARGNLIRIDNTLAGMSERLENVKARLENLYTQVDAAKAELGKPFAMNADLEQKSSRLAELNAMLNMEAGGSERQNMIAKSPRPSVLDSLKRTPPLRFAEKKAHPREQEAR